MSILESTKDTVGEVAFRIGRAPRADFIVDVTPVSCTTVRARSDDLKVVDLASTNGTYMDDKLITGLQPIA